jgi:hypothetical protein
MNDIGLTRLEDPFVPTHFLSPVELRQLLAIYRVALVIERTIVHEFNMIAFLEAEITDQRSRKLQVRDLKFRTDVINFPNFTKVQYKVKGIRDI